MKILTHLSKQNRKLIRKRVCIYDLSFTQIILVLEVGPGSKRFLALSLIIGLDENDSFLVSYSDQRSDLGCV